MEQASDTVDVSSELQSLLLLRPAEANVERLLVLTTTPSLWTERLSGTAALIVDLSRLLGLQSIPARGDTTETALVLRRFLRAGWPRSVLQIGYQPDLRLSPPADIAMLDRAGVWELAVEIRPSALLFAHSIRQRLDGLQQRTNARWVCVTDGEKYYLQDAQGRQRTFASVPSPAELGVDLGEEAMTAGTHVLPPVVSPPTAQELTAAALHWQPEAAVIDFTVPIDRQYAPQQVLYDPSSPVRKLLPDDVQGLPRERVGLGSVLLAWCARLSSIEAVTAVVPPTIISGSSDGWLPTYLSGRLPLCALLDLPAGLSHFARSGPLAVAYLGGERSQAYFDRLTSRGDLMAVSDRRWFQSLTGWLARDQETGPQQAVLAEAAVEYDASYPKVEVSDELVSDEAAAPTGYTADTTPLEARVREENPELDATYQRLERLGDTFRLDAICEVVTGGTIPRAVDPSGLPLLEPRSFQGGSVDLAGAARVSSQGIPEEELVRAGDVLLSLAEESGADAVLYEQREPAIPGVGAAALRLRDSRFTASYVLDYLNSPAAQKALRGGSVGAIGMSMSRLCALPVPLLGRDYLDALGAVGAAEVALRAKADEIGSRRRALFDAHGRGEFQHNLGQLRNQGKLLSLGMRALESLEYRIAVTYPFPIAFGYRLLESPNDPRELLTEQFRVAENLLAFLACIGLAIVQPQDRSISVTTVG